MRKNDFVPKYQYYTNNKDLVVAVCRWGGRTVRASAKCAPEDTFDFEKGKELAKARLNLKVAGLRLKNAEYLQSIAKDQFNYFSGLMLRYSSYYNDALSELCDAKDAYTDVINKL